MISDSSETAYTRLDVHGPVYNIVGEMLAVDKDDLFDDELLTPIVYNEFGSTSGPSRFWQGSTNDGMAKGDNCQDWSPDGGRGNVGARNEIRWFSQVPGGGDCSGDSEVLACISPLMAPTQ